MSVARSAGGEKERPPASRRARRKASIGWATRSGWATAGSGGLTRGRNDHHSRSSSVMPRPGGIVSGSGRVVGAPAATQRSRIASSSGVTLSVEGGISAERIRATSKLAPASPRAIAGPESPPRSIERTCRRSRFPSKASPAPWQSKQWARRIGRMSRSKERGASSAGACRAIPSQPKARKVKVPIGSGQRPVCIETGLSSGGKTPWKVPEPYSKYPSIGGRGETRFVGGVLPQRLPPWQNRSIWGLPGPARGREGLLSCRRGWSCIGVFSGFCWARRWCSGGVAR